MVRDPVWAHAYWELSSDRMKDAVESPGRGQAFLRLIGVTTGHVLAEHSIRSARGSHDFPLQAANRSYVLELAIRREYRQLVLARSNVVHAPQGTPRSAAAPAFVSRAQQVRALTEGRTLEPTGGEVPVLTPRVGESPQAPPSTVGRSQVGPPASMGSEPRFRLDSEPRPAQLGSEARLIRREPQHIPFVIARSPRTPESVAAALSALAEAVWFGREPADVLTAGTMLERALADAGISFGPAVAVLDAPGRDVAPPGHDARDTPAPPAAGYTAAENPDGSLTVVGPDGSSITYTPVVEGSGTRSAAAVIGVRQAC